MTLSATNPMPTVQFQRETQLVERAERAGQSQQDAALRQAARDFEGIFLQQLFQEMRRGVGESGDAELGMGIYQSMFDEAVAGEAAGQSGIGLANVLLQFWGVPPDPGAPVPAAHAGRVSDIEYLGSGSHQISVAHPGGLISRYSPVLEPELAVGSWVEPGGSLGSQADSENLGQLRVEIERGASDFDPTRLSLIRPPAAR